jgi:high-affinity iron transporter
VSLLSGPLLDLGPDVVSVSVIFLAVVLLSWHAWWMQRHARAVRGQVEQRIDLARATQRLWIVALIAFTSVFREGAETVLFLWGLMAQAGSSSAWASMAGGVAGIGTAGALGWLIFRGGKSISLRSFFAITTAFVMLLSAGLLASGVARLQGLGLLPMASPLWDTSHLLSDRTFPGSFLGGLVGYRAQPSAFEVGAYLVYLVGAGLLIYAGKTPAAASAAESRPTRARAA